MILAVDVPREVFQSTHPARGATERGRALSVAVGISIHAPREGCDPRMVRSASQLSLFQSTHPARGATFILPVFAGWHNISIHAPREGCDGTPPGSSSGRSDFNPRTPRGVRPFRLGLPRSLCDFNPRTPRGVRQQTLPKSREFAWLNLLICTRGRRLSIQKQTRLCSIKLSFMLFGCEPAGEGVSSWTSHATKSKVRLEGRSA